MAKRIAWSGRHHPCSQQRRQETAYGTGANDNAKQALARSKMSRISDMGARSDAMNDVAKALGLEQAPLLH